MLSISPDFQQKIDKGIPNNMRKTIGILGGMGPLATVDLFNKIVGNTPAKKDQDHHLIVIYNNPQVPPRVHPFDKGEKSPLQELIRSTRVLESAGADFIIIPCNAAHIWLDELKKSVNVPFHSMIDNTVQHLLKHKVSGIDKALLLATETTIRARLYQNAFINSSYKIVVPQADEQRLVHRAIEEVKAGKIKTNGYINDLNQLVQKYQTKGISIVIGGCTEIPPLFPYIDTSIKMIDPTLLLAQMAILKANT